MVTVVLFLMAALALCVMARPVPEVKTSTRGTSIAYASREDMLAALRIENRMFFADVRAELDSISIEQVTSSVRTSVVEPSACKVLNINGDRVIDESGMEYTTIGDILMAIAS